MFYESKHCRLLKEFKSHSHVMCPNKLEQEQGFAVEELNLQHKVKTFRGRRHSFIDSMDMRDFLEPDKYHRYDRIVRYLKVTLKVIFAFIAES